MSEDDMNIIQIERPAVSRYHQQQRFFMAGEGPDHQTHDFPSSHLGIKLGGFMTLHAATPTIVPARGSVSAKFRIGLRDHSILLPYNVSLSVQLARCRYQWISYCLVTGGSIR